MAPFFFNDTATTEIYTLSLHDALPISFSEAVSGVDAGDFTLTTSGTSGASITSIGGSSSSHTAAVQARTRLGARRLDLDDDDSIADAAGNVLSGPRAGTVTGPTYTIDN